MFLKRPTSTFTGNCWEQIEKLKQEIRTDDAITIGAGAGLSASAGFTYTGERFSSYFADFEQKYGFHDMYYGGFYPYKTPEEHWVYWSRYIWINRYRNPPKPTYSDLLKLVEGRDYFVITTNVDHCFQKAGFDKRKLFYTQGDYGLFQCSEPCCQETFENEETIRAMVEQQKNMRVPSKLLPVCPHCGKPLTMNLRSDDRFVQDEGWYEAAERYEDFLQRHQRDRILYLELGVGMNTPGIVKFSFRRMTARNPKAVYVCVNLGEAGAPREIASRSICIDGDIGEVLKKLK